MFGFNDSIHSRKILMVFFALISGASAVSTAILPGVLHI
jgi:hypothetical protein